MKKMVIFATVFIYADISNILYKINKIENYTPVFKKLYLKGCNNKKPEKKVLKTTKKTLLRLMAVFNDKALINNRWVKKGDFINGYKIVKIYPKKVFLKKGGYIFVLKFNNSLLRIKK